MSCQCQCLQNNLVAESLVVVLTLVSGLAITGENLIVFNLITVPQSARTVENMTSINDTAADRAAVIITESTQAKSILTKVFHYASLGIAGLFFIEIVLKMCTLQKRFIINPWQVNPAYTGYKTMIWEVKAACDMTTSATECRLVYKKYGYIKTCEPLLAFSLNKCVQFMFQMFDCLVVVTSLTFELTFHFVNPGHKGLYSLTYIVLLRLWRIPMLCNIRAIAVLEASEYDLELYRNGRIKAEDRCRLLETTLVQRNEDIKKLERMLHDLTGSKQTDPANSNEPLKKNGHLPYKTYKTDDVLNVKCELPSSMSSDRQSYSLLLKSAHKQTKQTLPGDSETHFMSTNDLESPSTLSKVSTELSSAQLYKQIAKKSQTVCEEKDTDGNNSSNTDTSAINGSDSIQRKSTPAAVNNNDLCSENTSSSLATSPPPQQPQRRSQMFLRSRKRRSSASEILDYLNLASPSADRLFYDSSRNDTSTQNSDLEKDTLITKDIHEGACAANAGNTNDRGDTGGMAAVSPEEKKQRQVKRRTRRFASCPEYVFTQRMNITNDESLLIGDGHATGEHFEYSNLGFNCDEHVFYPVMSEYDGSTTYRNEDGIPMTSL